jgi:hypothetical protein
VALTPNLKLRTDIDLTADARYNLLRIDSLGALIKSDNTGDTLIRSLAEIILAPNSADLGGSGSGGIVSVGEAGSIVDEFRVFANNVDFNGADVVGFEVTELITDSWVSPTAGINISKLGDGTISNTEFGYLAGLTGNIQAQINSATGTNQLAANWLAADGTVKAIAHNFGSNNVLVQVLDSGNNYERIGVASIVNVDTNTIQLTATEAPSATWVVLLAQVS